MRWLVALLLLTSIALAQSNPPPQAGGPQTTAEQKAAAENKQQSEPDQRGTDKSPLIVKMQDSEKTQGEAEKDPYYQQRRAADDRMFLVGVWSIIIGAVQALALFATFLIIAFVAIRQLRAYVYPSIGGLKHFSLTEPIQIIVEWKNCGATPAREFLCHGIVWVAPLPMPSEAAFQDAEEPKGAGKHSKATLYPGSTSNADYFSVERPIPNAVIDAIVQGEFAIYVVAEAYYRDVFWCKRKTQYCQFIDSKDAATLIDAERRNIALKDFEVKFVASHSLNDFT
jgi:hypothetical protein